MAETQDEQLTQDRAALAKEVWESEAIQKASEPAEQQAAQSADAAPQEAEPTTDQWANVPAAVKEEFEGMRAKMAGLSQMEMRLKQAESRLGGVQNELHAAKVAAKAVKEAPTSEQIKAAADSQGDWEALKVDFPEWATATEGRLAAERAEILKQMPDVNQLREEQSAGLAKIRMEMLGSVVAIKHPKWKEVNSSADFAQWRAENGDLDSEDPNEVIAILDNYAAYVATKKSPKDIAAEREARLALSETKQTSHKVRAPKSEADMTPAEIRASVAAQVWHTA